jgi:uncharacterized membrane protein YdbT with pleckstrin-like domain
MKQPIDRKPRIIDAMERHLTSGETIEVRTGPHWIVFLRSIITGTIILIVGGMLVVAELNASSAHSPIFAGLSAGAVAIALGVLVGATLRRNSQAVVVTNDRIVEMNGVLHHSTTETRLDSIQNISVDQSIVGRLLNYGTITLRTANGEPMVLKNIAFPQELHQALKDHQTRIQDRAAEA